MRLIPGKTKVKIELFKGVGVADIIIGLAGAGLVTLMLLSTFPGRIYIAVGIAVIFGALVFRLDNEPTYMFIFNLLKYIAYPRAFMRPFSDELLIAKAQGMSPGEYLDSIKSEKKEVDDEDPFDLLSPAEKKKQLRELIKEEDRILKSKTATDEEKNAVWLARARRSEAKKKEKKEARESRREEVFMEEVVPYTGFSDGFIEYGGKYYGAVIEIAPVEFRFFSTYRRNNAIEDCFGKILRSVKGEYAFNIIKIERPVLYDSYLEKEYDRLDDLRASYEKGMLSEEELKARVEIQYDRIETMRNLCSKEKVIQPHYYVAMFESDKRQLSVEAANAILSLKKAELTVRRLTSPKELAVFLKYTNHLDFEEKDIEKIDPEDYVAWASPEDLSFTMRTATIDGVISHHMRVTDYPSIVGDAWIAGVMSIPGTKVMVKCSAMDRSKAIRAIDRSLQELRGQYASTSIDSKLIELQTHIETLSSLLATLQHDNEALLTVNIYITMYDSVLTAQGQGEDKMKASALPVIADMKKVIRRNWQETGMKLNSMDFAQLQGFLGSQVSAYDPCLNDGRGIPANTIAAMYPWIYSHISDEGGIRLGISEGVPVFIDFFRRDSERVNSNMVIIGKSGSGKSYGTKSLLVNMAAEDAKIFILDPENEYTELAHNLGGKIINVGNAKSGRLNPFHIITALEDDESGTDDEGGSFSTHMQFLEEFFRQILPDIDKEALEYLNTLVERTYTHRHITMETDLSRLAPEDYPIFDDLYDVVLEEFERTSNEYLRTMLQTLVNYVSKFATGGRNANIWNGPSSITTDENFSVFNFQSLLANRNTTIANAQMLLVLKYIDNEIIKNRDYNRKYGLNRKIVVVIDEAHVFIDTKFPVALDFMFQLAKRIRKYNGMQIVITQNIKDFVGSEEIARKSTAIINACQYSFILGLAPNDMDDLCKLYEKAGGINEMEQEQILSAPRGQAFTVMSPTSRSSFQIGVSDTMVDIFERADHVNSYFDMEGGAENWDEFIGDSRAEHEANLTERRMAETVTEEVEKKEKKSMLNFSEITVEEADAMAEPEKEEKPKFGSITFSEVDADDVAEIPGVSIPDDDTPANTPPAVDMDEMVASLKRELSEEIRKEVTESLRNVMEDVPSAQAQTPEPTEEFHIPSEEEFSLPEDEFSIPEEEFGLPGEDFGESAPKSEDTGVLPTEDEDYSFDFMALLDEQMAGFAEMTIDEKMDEIEVDRMEISLEELTMHVKLARKKAS